VLVLCIAALTACAAATPVAPALRSVHTSAVTATVPAIPGDISTPSAQPAAPVAAPVASPAAPARGPRSTTHPMAAAAGATFPVVSVGGSGVGGSVELSPAVIVGCADLGAPPG